MYQFMTTETVRHLFNTQMPIGRRQRPRKANEEKCYLNYASHQKVAHVYCIHYTCTEKILCCFGFLFFALLQVVGCCVDTMCFCVSAFLRMLLSFCFVPFLASLSTSISMITSFSRIFGFNSFPNDAVTFTECAVRLVGYRDSKQQLNIFAVHTHTHAHEEIVCLLLDQDS